MDNEPRTVDDERAGARRLNAVTCDEAQIPLGRRPSTRLYRSPEVVFAADISYRQLDWWIRYGIVVPTVPAHGSGTQRLFSWPTVVACAVLGEVSRALSGVPNTELARAILVAVENAVTDDAPSVLVITLRPSITLSIDLDDFLVPAAHSALG